MDHFFSTKDEEEAKQVPNAHVNLAVDILIALYDSDRSGE